MGAKNSADASIRPVSRRGLVRASVLGAAVLAVLPLAACSKEDASKDADASKTDGASTSSTGVSATSTEEKAAVTQLNKVDYPETLASSDFEKLEKLESENPLESDFLGGLSTFANNLAVYGIGEAELTDDAPNICLSPASLYLTLALLAQGARGDTQTQLLNALGLDDAGVLATQCEHLIRRLWAQGTPEGDARESTLQLASSVWARADVPFEKDFLDKAGKRFFAECYEVDEVGYDAGEAMGAWIANHTGASEKPQVDLADDWVASLIDTIWFKDSWTNPFNENDTAQDTFHAITGDVTCDFMTKELECGYAATDEYQIASLALDTGAHLELLLPAEGGDPQAYFARATGVGQLFRSATVAYARVALTVPKVAFGVRSQLADVCQRMGVIDAFAEGADLSGMTSATAHVSTIEQGTRFSLNEMGVEASAYTNASVNVTSVMATDHEVMEMRIDRTFGFYLSDKDGTVLFAGVVGNPAVAS